MKILIPELGKKGLAITHTAIVAKTTMTKMPLPATRHNFAKIFKTLVNRPYGWGGMYFYNDCSQELKSLFAPFGFWLPRQSSDQTSSGKMVDMSEANAEDRISYLEENGRPLMTIVYIGGHVFLYVGNYTDPNSQASPEVIIYQNIWGLKPEDGSSRVVIGGSVFFPLLNQYPEDTSLVSLADKKYFKIAYLDEQATTETLFNQIILGSLLP
mgnify:CR=1 FL=1